MHFGGVGLILGQVVGHAVGFLRLGRNALMEYRERRAHFKMRGIRWAAKRYRRFALFDSWAALLSTAGAHVPILLFAGLLGTKLAGFYLLAIRLFSAPITLIGKSISQVLLPRAVEGRRTGKLAYLVRNVLRSLAVLAFAPFLIVAVVAPSAFGFLFGEEWAAAGPIASYTACWVAWQFVFSPLSVVLVAAEAQRTNLAIQMASFLLRSLAIYVGCLLGDEMFGVIFFSVVSFVVYLTAVLLVARCAGLGILICLQDLGMEVAMAVLIVAPLLVFMCGPAWAISLAVLFSGAIWCARAHRTISGLSALK
jgi:O-antigen/teichoic acid export membrane protein